MCATTAGPEKIWPAQAAYLVVLGEPLGAARGAGLDLARAQAHGKVGDVVVLSCAHQS